MITSILNKPKNSGFTLIEVLIALLIMAIIATLGIMGLQAVILSDQRQIQVTDELAEMQFAYLLIQRDISQAINRPIIDGVGEWRPGLLGASGLGAHFVSDMPVEGEILLEFTRAGVPNPLQLLERSSLQRVTYVYDGKKLSRYEWLVLDRSDKSVFSQRVLLPEISNVQLTYFDQYGGRITQWATEVPAAPAWLNNYPQVGNLPSAIGWNFEHPRYGPILWIFRLNEVNYEGE